MVPSLTCLVVGADFEQGHLHVAWASGQHGSWVPRVSISRDRKRKLPVSEAWTCKLAEHHFCGIFLVKQSLVKLLWVCWCLKNLLGLFCYLNIVGSPTSVTLPLPQRVFVYAVMLLPVHMSIMTTVTAPLRTIQHGFGKNCIAILTCSFHFTNVETEAKNRVDD